MTNLTYTSTSEIFYSSTYIQQVVKEHVVPFHALTYILGGKLLVRDANTSYVINEGETILFRKNQLVKATKCPGADSPFKSITLFFTAHFLQKFYTTFKPAFAPAGLKLKLMNRNPIVSHLFHSILSDYESGENFSEEFIDSKLTEAITVLRTIDPETDTILSDNVKPGKIDLGEFMHANYIFNIPINRFAYLTGRSLATFKRDFHKKFNLPPQKWLLQKRLQKAHYLITEQHKKPTDVYMEVGFENLSHFSYSFKQFFGYNASKASPVE